MEPGPWWITAQCHNRWVHLGVWERLLALAQERGGDAKLGMAFVDCGNVRAHRCAAGAAKKRGSAERDARETLGRSRSDYGVNAIALADSHGRAMGFVLAPG